MIDPISRTKATQEADDLKTRANAIYKHIRRTFSREAMPIILLVMIIM